MKTLLFIAAVSLALSARAADPFWQQLPSSVPPGEGYTVAAGAWGYGIDMVLYENGSYVASGGGDQWTDEDWPYQDHPATVEYSAMSMSAGNYRDYSASATDASGEGWTSGTVWAEGPPYIANHPQSVTKRITCTATFGVEALSSTDLTYQWKKNGVTITGATAPELTFNNVQTSDAGGYVVVVSNVYGTVTSNAATLTVVDSAPVLQLSSQTSTSATLSWTLVGGDCGVSGYNVYATKAGVVSLIGQTTAAVISFTHSRFPGTTYDYFVKVRDGLSNLSLPSNTVTSSTPGAADSDADGIPDSLESLFSNSNPATDAAVALKVHRPTP